MLYTILLAYFPLHLMFNIFIVIKFVMNPILSPHPATKENLK